MVAEERQKGRGMVRINPTENRDQHCKVYVEKSLKKAIFDYADKMHMSFSEASRRLIITGLNKEQE